MPARRDGGRRVQVKRVLCGLAALVAACALGGCHQEPSAPPAPAPPAGKSDARADVSGAGDAALGSQPPPDAGVADAGIAKEGQWIEAASYRVRLDEVVGCGAAALAGRSWMGARFDLQAHVDRLFVSPRDFTLERGGIILQAKFIDPPALPRCAPLLAPKVLRVRQAVAGFVLFEIPPSFRAARGPVTLAYQPTRWGGARRATIRIPDCLDACAAAGNEERSPKPGRARKKRPRGD